MSDDTSAFPSDVTFAGCTLSLRTETTLSLYFECDRTINLNCPSKSFDIVTTDEYQIIRIRNINASDLTKDISIYVDGGAVFYNPMCYCYSAINDSSRSAKIKDVCKALWLYSEAIKEYTK